jgi:hypothetical protein
MYCPYTGESPYGLASVSNLEAEENDSFTLKVATHVNTFVNPLSIKIVKTVVHLLDF